jgi:hypothetical protein
MAIFIRARARGATQNHTLHVLIRQDGAFLQIGGVYLIQHCGFWMPIITTFDGATDKFISHLSNPVKDAGQVIG